MTQNDDSTNTIKNAGDPEITHVIQIGEKKIELTPGELIALKNFLGDVEIVHGEGVSEDA